MKTLIMLTVNELNVIYGSTASEDLITNGEGIPVVTGVSKPIYIKDKIYNIYLYHTLRDSKIQQFFFFFLNFKGHIIPSKILRRGLSQT